MAAVMWGAITCWPAISNAGDTKNWNSGRGFEPIGRLDRTGAGVTGSFSGVFDGMGYGIQNLYIKRSENYDDGYIGLFEGIGKGGSVGNVNIVGGHIEGIQILVVLQA